MVFRQLKSTGERVAFMFYPFVSRIKAELQSLYAPAQPAEKFASSTIGIDDLVRLVIQYTRSMRLKKEGEFIGYRHSDSSQKPVLYDTLAALLIKHLCHVKDGGIQEELECVLHFQSDDGLFRDPVIACEAAETEDWWGWRHLTLHALMTLGLYDIPASKKLLYIDRWADSDAFRKYLHSRDWGKRVAWTSNELQNVGTMLQYARDYQDLEKANSFMDIIRNNQCPPRPRNRTLW